MKSSSIQAWHDLLHIACSFGLHSGPWRNPQPGAHVARAAGTYMLNQIESGVYCPLAMTYGSVPTLRHAPKIAEQWLPTIFAPRYDPRFIPVREKTGALIGMGLTENQGGSDLRTNSTRAEPSGDGYFRLHGHKWFLSVPMCDAFLVLAQSPKGLSCFFMPRWTPDGHAQRSAHQPAEGQARQQVERIERGGIRRRLCAVGRRRRARHPDHDRDGGLHTA